MEQLNTGKMINIPAENPPEQEIDFKPKGAIAFFSVLILLGLIIWFGIYFIMLSRS